MHAIVQHGYGHHAVSAERIARPTPGEGEVLIRVRAASVNHADGVFVTGRPYIARLAFGLRTPRIKVRGRDVAGIVEAVGAGVTQFAAGDEVYGEVDTGSFAEYVATPQTTVARKPSNLTFEQAAAVPVAGRAALHGLRDGGQIRPGQRVLINGASGGVGSFAVQIAKAWGTEVTAVCSAANADQARSLGADHVLDYASEDFTRSTQRYDVVLDNIGNHTVQACRRALTPAGTLVLSSGTGGRVFGPLPLMVWGLLQSLFATQTVRAFVTAPVQPSLDVLRDLIESGQITPTIERTYPLGETPDALRHFEEGHARAKIVIMA
ncbi:hypothetical protein GY21_09720 [Cryobacterium roopkundense]|nr:hypothetical protein GY21_09720 [Cryobacterium roopkundense]